MFRRWPLREPSRNTRRSSASHSSPIGNLKDGSCTTNTARFITSRSGRWLCGCFFKVENNVCRAFMSESRNYIIQIKNILALIYIINFLQVLPQKTFERHFSRRTRSPTWKRSAEPRSDTQLQKFQQFLKNERENNFIVQKDHTIKLDEIDPVTIKIHQNSALTPRINM